MSKDPYNVPGQDPLLFELLQPKHAFDNIQDPDYQVRMMKEMCMTQITIPSGYNAKTFTLYINKKDKKTMYISIEKFKTTFEEETVCGSDLISYAPNLVKDFCRVNQNHFHKSKGDGMKLVTLLAKHFKIKLLKPLEKDFRLTFTNWARISPDYEKYLCLVICSLDSC